MNRSQDSGMVKKSCLLMKELNNGSQIENAETPSSLITVSVVFQEAIKQP
jgi:hypothetical protein